MKLKKIVMRILLALLVIVGIEGMVGFWAEHSYYTQMILSRRNFALVGSAALCAWIPLAYLNSKKKLTLKRFVLGLGIGLGLFSFLHALITGSLLTLFAGVPLLFNTLLLYILAVSFLFGIFGLGNRVARKLKLFQTLRRQESLLTFGIGLVIFLVFMQILMGIQLFYSLVIWLIFAGMLFLARKERRHMKAHEEAILGVFEQFQIQKTASKC